MNQTQNSPEKKIVIKKGIYIFSRLNLESLLSYFKQARDCKLQSVWIEKNLYKCFVQAQKGKSLNIQYMKDACPTSKQLSAQKRKNNLTFCQSFPAVFKLKYLAICNVVSMTPTVRAEPKFPNCPTSPPLLPLGGENQKVKVQMETKICILHPFSALEKEKRGR